MYNRITDTSIGYNKSEYISFIKNNKYLTTCQKTEFLNIKKNIFYVDQTSNQQIQTYLQNVETSHDLYGQVRFMVLLNHFLKYDFASKLMKEIKDSKMSDKEVYEYVVAHPKGLIDKSARRDKIYCSQYTYTFEKLALILYTKYLKSDNKSSLKYLDVSCGNGSKTKLFANKMGLSQSHVWGTDVETWGPYLADKSQMPIQFKLLTDSKLDFKDNEFDILSVFLALHHYPPADLEKLLKEFKRVLKPSGILVVIEHNILDDFDHLIVDIEHSMNSYLYDKKPDDTYASYFNYMELDFVLGMHGFYWMYGYQMTSNVGFGVRYDNPFYALYANTK
jgi:SAM-dependent methyltransferase